MNELEELERLVILADIQEKNLLILHDEAGFGIYYQDKQEAQEIIPLENKGPHDTVKDALNAAIEER